MKAQSVYSKIAKGLKFLPEVLLRLIHTNITAVLDIRSWKKFDLTDLERTVDINNSLTCCKATFSYDDGKIVFTIRFNDKSLKSMLWSIS